MGQGIAGTDIHINTEETIKEMREKTLRLLKEKYHEDFELVSIRVPVFSSEYARAAAASERYPDLPFRVFVDCEGDGESDTYVTRMIGHRITENIREQLNGLKGTYGVFAVPVIDNCTIRDAEISVEEYMKTVPEQGFTIHFFYVPEEDGEPDPAMLSSELQKTASGIPTIHGTLKLYLTDEKTLAQVQEYMDSHTEPGFGFAELSDGILVHEIRFRDGIVPVTEEDLADSLKR